MGKSWNRRQGMPRQHETLRLRGAAPAARIVPDNAPFFHRNENGQAVCACYEEVHMSEQSPDEVFPDCYGITHARAWCGPTSEARAALREALGLSNE